MLKKWLPHGGISKIFFLPYVLDLIEKKKKKFCPDSNLRVKLMYESVKYDVLMYANISICNFAMREVKALI